MSKWTYLLNTLNDPNNCSMSDSDLLRTVMLLPFVDRVTFQVDIPIDNNTWNTVFHGYARYGAGFNNWRGIAICGAGLDGTELTV